MDPSVLHTFNDIYRHDILAFGYDMIVPPPRRRGGVGARPFPPATALNPKTLGDVQRPSGGRARASETPVRSVRRAPHHHCNHPPTRPGRFGKVVRTGDRPTSTGRRSSSFVRARHGVVSTVDGDRLGRRNKNRRIVSRASLASSRLASRTRGAIRCDAVRARAGGREMDVWPGSRRRAMRSYSER